MADSKYETTAAYRQRVRTAIENALETFQLGEYNATQVWIERAGARLVDLKERVDAE